VPRPGEASLAHHGVLFLDELPEFPRAALEALRQPLEDGHLTVVRAAASARLPARFALVAAANPCPCGYAGDGLRACRCSEHELRRYGRKLSGPLLDRIDLCVQVERVRPEELGAMRLGEPSADVRARVTAARDRQIDRGHGVNARLDAGHLSRRDDLIPDARAILTAAANRLGLTARSSHRTLRVARTIADLLGASQITTDHVVEALSYRQFPTFDIPEGDDPPADPQEDTETEDDDVAGVPGRWAAPGSWGAG
jgi:magnesium chelatase family protein